MAKLPGFGKLGGRGLGGAKPSLGEGPSPGLGATKLPGLGRHGPSKPHLRSRHLSVVGHSAFPSQNAAFPSPAIGDDGGGGAPGGPGPPGPDPSAAFMGGSPQAGPGDMGQ